MNVETGYLRRVERWTLVVAAVLVAASLVALPRPVALACAVGAGIECANASAIRWMTERAARSAGGATPMLGLLLFNLKMLVLMVAVWVALRVLHLDGIGFVLGISVFPVAFLGAALSARLEPASSITTGPTGTTGPPGTTPATENR